MTAFADATWLRLIRRAAVLEARRALRTPGARRRRARKAAMKWSPTR